MIQLARVEVGELNRVQKGNEEEKEERDVEAIENLDSNPKCAG